MWWIETRDSRTKLGCKGRILACNFRRPYAVADILGTKYLSRASIATNLRVKKIWFLPIIFRNDHCRWMWAHICASFRSYHRVDSHGHLDCPFFCSSRLKSIICTFTQS